MKIFKLLFLSVLVSTMVACSSDDDSNDNGGGDTTGDLVATWVGVSVEYTGTSVSEITGFPDITTEFVGTGYDIDYTMTFDENPNEISSTGSYSIELVTTFEGQSTTQNVENLSWLNIGEWSRTGDEVSVTVNGETSTMTIVELTDTTLSINIVDVSVIEQQGITKTATTNLNATYTKQ